MSNQFIGNVGATVELRIVRNADASISIAVTESGSAKNLLGYTARMYVRTHHKSVTDLDTLTTENSRISIAGGSGIVTLTFNDTDTDDVTWSTGVYRLDIISAAGVVTRLLDGEIKLVYAGDADEEPTNSLTVAAINSLTLEITVYTPDATLAEAAEALRNYAFYLPPLDGAFYVGTGVQGAPIRVPYDMPTDCEAVFDCDDAPVGQSLIFQIYRNNGATLVATLTIVSSAVTASADLLVDLVADDLLTVNCTQVGSSDTGANGRILIRAT